MISTVSSIFYANLSYKMGFNLVIGIF